jgi:hypothetical protein
MATDFESEEGVHVIFQISNYTRVSADVVENQWLTNSDFWWKKLADKAAPPREAEYEESVAKDAEDSYLALLTMIHGGKTAVTKADEEDKSMNRQDLIDNHLWKGEVGRMVFWRSRDAPREFTWALHHDPDGPSPRKAG